MSMRGTLAALALAVGLGACTLTPSVTRTKATLGEVDMTGLDCRTDRPIDSNLPRTICASAQSWAAYDRQQAEKADRLMDEMDRLANSDPFGRMRR